MVQNPKGSIEAHFSGLEDPHIERQKLHNLFYIILIAICGAYNWANSL